MSLFPAIGWDIRGSSQIGLLVRFLATEADSRELLSAASLSLQVAVAGYALWLNRIFGTKKAGWALCGAFVLMLAMHLNEAFSPAVTESAFGIRPELAYVFISFLLLLGLSHLAGLYRERQAAEEAIRRARDELEIRVRERTAELAEEVEQRKKAEAEIRASQQLYRGLVDSLEGIIFECDDQLRFTFVSAQSERLFGLAPEKWVAEITWKDMTLMDDYAPLQETCRRAMREQTGASLEFRVFGKDRKARWVRLVASGVASAKGDRRIRGVLLDVTDRKQLEDSLRQAQKMDAVGRLSGAVAHDFNNIVTIIQGYAELLIDGEQSSQGPTQCEYLQHIRDAAERGSQLTGQLLAFSRKGEMQIKAVDLNQLVAGTAKMLGVLLGESIEVQLDLADKLLPIQGDTGQLSQVLVNLAVNARDAMPKGGRLTISTDSAVLNESDRATNPEVRAGTFDRIAVSDSGTGIPATVLPHIFEPFFTTKEPGKGTGLGLATVYGIVKQHGGWIQVDTAENQGTTFGLFLPAKETADPLPAPERALATHRDGRNATILLVEDDATVLHMTSSILKNHGYRVLEAASGPSALRIWKSNQSRVDLLLTDVAMPDGMSGWDLVQHLRETDPCLKAVAMSGYGPEFPPGLSVPFLGKPFPPDSLLQAIEDALDTPAREVTPQPGP
jgi:two-component system cell cycle sensor histidine kinase/response regulator CckA